MNFERDEFVTPALERSTRLESGYVTIRAFIVETFSAGEIVKIVRSETLDNFVELTSHKRYDESITSLEGANATEGTRYATRPATLCVEGFCNTLQAENHDLLRKMFVHSNDEVFVRDDLQQDDL